MNILSLKRQKRKIITSISSLKDLIFSSVYFSAKLYFDKKLKMNT